MKVMKKRGLSPVIATVLLISIALVLAIIIFLWARAFVSENVVKFGEPVENSCNNVIFEAEADSQTVYIVNKGSAPIYAIEIRKKTKTGTFAGDIGEEGDREVLGGGTGEIEYQSESGDELLLVPYILGESKNSKVMHQCDTKFGVPVTVA